MSEKASSALALAPSACSRGSWGGVEERCKRACASAQRPARAARCIFTGEARGLLYRIE
jgi:hypothetical protein